MTVDSLRRAAPEAVQLQARVRAALALLGVASEGPDAVALLEAAAARLSDERRRFIAANAELGLLTVRQGYALRVLREAAERLRTAVGERQRAEARAAHDDTGEAAAAHAAAHAAVPGAFEALHEALAETDDEARSAGDAQAQLVAERDALRATVDGEAMPSAEAIEAHAAKDGRWLVLCRARWAVFDVVSARAHRDGVEVGWWRADESRWWPLDGAGLTMRDAAQAAEGGS